MKTDPKLISLFAIASGLFTGCLSRVVEESTVSLHPSEESYAVVADLYSDEAVTDTIEFHSNRSWSAKIEPADCDWLILEVVEHVNFSNAEEMVRIPMKFANNELGSARTAKIVFSTKGEKIEVPITQSAIVPRLEVLSGVEVNDISCDEGSSSTIKIKSNVPWTASQDAGLSNVDVSFDATSGKRNGEFKVIFPMNDAYDLQKTAVVTITGEGCDPVSVKLVQNVNVPNLELVSFSETLPSWKDPGFTIATPAKLFSTVSKGGKFSSTLKFSTNAPWEITVENSTFGDDLEFSQTEGTRGEHTITYSYSPNVNPNPYAQRKAKVTVSTRITSPGIENLVSSFDISQDPIMLLMVCDGTSYITSGGWPFSSPTLSQIPSSSSKATYKGEVVDFVTKTGHHFSVWTKSGIYRNSAQGFGMVDDGYIAFPVVEGKRMTSVYGFSIKTEKNWFITTASKGMLSDAANAVPGGEKKVFPKATMEQTWTFSESDPDVQYCIRKSGTGTALVALIAIQYE